MSRLFLRALLIIACTVFTPYSAFSQNLESNLRQANREIARLVAANRNDQKQTLEKMIRRREQGLKSLMKSNPDAVRRVVLPRSVTFRISGNLRDELETADASIEGKYMQTIAEDFSNAPVYSDFVVPKGHPDRHVQLHFGPTVRRPSTGSSISVKGTLIDENLAVTSLRTQADDITEAIPTGSRSRAFAMRAGAQSNTTSLTRRIAIIVFNRSSDVQQPFTTQEIRDAVFGASGSARQYFEEVSYGKMTFRGHLNPTAGDVFGWYTITSAVNDCNVYTWRDAAIAKATADGFNEDNYDGVIYIFPYASCQHWAGQASLTDGSVWINGVVPLSVITHEMGHTLGLHHANGYQCLDAGGQRVSISSNCTTIEYGDSYDLMGSGEGHFSAFNKLVMRDEMLSPSNSRDVTTSGTYSIAPLESFTSGVQNLRILRDSVNGLPKSYYYIEFRKVYGPISNGVPIPDPTAKGVVIRIAPPVTAGGFTRLIDATPETGDFVDAALPVGRSFIDAERGIQITTQNVSPTGATVAVNLGAGVCLRTSPSITISPPNHFIKAGDSVTYSATITNIDPPACSASTFRLIPSLPPGWTQIPGSDSVTLNPGQTVSRNITLRSQSNAPNGISEFTETITDQHASQFGAAASATVQITSAQVSLEFVTPSDGATVTGLVPLRATSNISSGEIYFRLNGGQLQPSSPYPGPYTTNWDTRSLPNGPQTLLAWTFDPANYPAVKSTSIVVNVNNPLPSVNIISPTSGAALSGLVTVTATIPSTAGASVVEFFDGETSLGYRLPPSAPNTFTTTWHTPSYGRDGPHTLTAVVYDQWNRVNRSTPITVMVQNFRSDTTPPNVDVVSPVNATSVSGVINLRAVATDANRVDAVDFFIDETQGLGELQATPYLMRWDSRTVSDGPHTIRARAYDSAGNVRNSSTITITVNNGGNGICAVDFDGTGSADNADLFAFLNAWINDEPRADFDRNGSISLADIFGFLAGWLVGC